MRDVPELTLQFSLYESLRHVVQHHWQVKSRVLQQLVTEAVMATAYYILLAIQPGSRLLWTGRGLASCISPVHADSIAGKRTNTAWLDFTQDLCTQDDESGCSTKGHL